MLTQDDLKAIGKVVDDSIEHALSDPQGVLNIKLDAMQEQFDGLEKKVDGIESRMLTIERLERYEVGMTERYDRRYVRQTPQEKTSA